jgi:hypothetical protein
MWSKTTWYSKLIALALLVVLPSIGFYYGEWHAQNAILADKNTASSSASTLGNTQTDYYNNVTEWQTDTNNDGGFSIAYPIDFQIDDNYSAVPSVDWRINANNTPGIKYITLTVPKVFEPQTNFADATLTVGASRNKTALAQCMTPDPTGMGTATTSTQNINGTEFTVFHSDGAGAGNYYETTGYRALHAGQCYAVEYTIHSSQIMNYPASYNLKPFNEKDISSVLQNIIGTFRFL